MRNQHAYELLQEMIDTDFERYQKTRREMYLLGQTEIVNERGPLVSFIEGYDYLLRWNTFDDAVEYFKLSGWPVMEIHDEEGYKVTYERR